MSGLDKLRVVRDEEGNLAPKEGETLTLGLKIKVLPMTYGQSQQYESFGLPIKRWNDKDKAALISNQLLEVEGEPVGDVKEEELGDFEAYAISDILEGILYMSAINRLYEEPDSGNAEDPATDEAGEN